MKMMGLSYQRFINFTTQIHLSYPPTDLSPNITKECYNNVGCDSL